MMHKFSVPVLVAAAIGFGTLGAPANVDTATGQFSAFLDRHDLLHPVEIEKREPHRVFIRKTFWDNDDRVLRVNAGSTQGKGALMIVEGLPESDWLTAFRIASDDGATFELPVPDGESVPCRILIKSGSAAAVATVQNAPTECADVEGAEPMLLASL
jgi:hypothetical protein